MCQWDWSAFFSLHFSSEQLQGPAEGQRYQRQRGKELPTRDTVYRISTSPLIIAVTGHTRDTGTESFYRHIRFPSSPPLIAEKCHSKIWANPEERSFPCPCLAVVVVSGEEAPQVPAWSQHWPGCLLPPLQRAELQQHWVSPSFLHWGGDGLSPSSSSSASCQGEKATWRSLCRLQALILNVSEALFYRSWLHSTSQLVSISKNPLVSLPDDPSMFSDTHECKTAEPAALPALVLIKPQGLKTQMHGQRNKLRDFIGAQELKGGAIKATDPGGAEIWGRWGWCSQTISLQGVWIWKTAVEVNAKGYSQRGH